MVYCILLVILRQESVIFHLDEPTLRVFIGEYATAWLAPAIVLDKGDNLLNPIDVSDGSLIKVYEELTYCYG